MIKDYRVRYCLFLDILGFKEIVDNSVRPAESSRRHSQASGIYFSLKKVADSLNYKAVFTGKSGKLVKSSRRVTQFSDSVVVSYSVKEIGGLTEMLYDVLHLQMELVQRGLLIRGAITKGPLHHDGDFVFGPALNEAAELEKVAMYPRVIVTQELLVDAGIVKVGGAVVRHELSRRPSSLVARDLDGVYFVDYFSAHPDDFSDDWGELVEYLISLREMIRGLAAMKQPSVRLKHSWLRQKFNDIAEPLERSRYGILGAHAVPEDEEDHIVNVSPFR